MIKPGLVSITFRDRTPEKILDLAEKAGIAGIEWGGDVHVPHGDTQRAEKVAAATRERGLQVAAYGSYYWVAAEKRENPPFEQVLASAEALTAPLIRVWAGDKGSAAADDSYRQRAADELRELCEMVQRAGIYISVEYHTNTLTDTNESALELLKRVDHPAMTTYWQPPNDAGFEYRLEGLKMVLPWVSNVHVFHWQAPGKKRRPLEEGSRDWEQYLQLLTTTGRNHYAMTEFVMGNTPEQYLRDAAALRKCISQVS